MSIDDQHHNFEDYVDSLHAAVLGSQIDTPNKQLGTPRSLKLDSTPQKDAEQYTIVIVLLSGQFHLYFFASCSYPLVI